jgi:hypothetical protein
MGGRGWNKSSNKRSIAPYEDDKTEGKWLARPLLRPHVATNKESRSPGPIIDGVHHGAELADLFGVQSPILVRRLSSQMS